MSIITDNDVDSVRDDELFLAERPGPWRLALIVLCTALMLPLLLVDVPPLLDYPNHMARMYVLAAGAGDPILSKMYAPHWAIIPNLALDLLIPPTLGVLPLHVAGRLAIACAILLPVLGCVALNRAVFRVRSWWPLAASLPAYNVALRLGLLNFLMAVGLALLIAAAWEAWRDRRPLPVLVLAAAGAAALFFCHIMGLAMLMLLLGCRELAAALAERRWSSLLERGAWLAAVFALPLLLFARSQVAGTWTVIVWDSPSARLYGAFAAFICDSRLLDVLTGTACFLVVYLCLRKRRGETRSWLVAAALVLAACYLAAPTYFKGTGFFATRFAVMFGFLIFAGVRPRLPPRAGAAVMAGLAALFVVRLSVISAIWWAHNTDLAEIRQTIAPVEPGSRVLVVAVTEHEAPDYWAGAPAGRTIPAVFEADLHEAALLLTEHRAFWPDLFANLDQQPLTVLPPYRAIASPEGAVPPHRVLSGTADAETTMLFPIPADWQAKFDYVLLLDAGGEPDLAGWAGDRLSLLRRSDAAALFRVK